MVGLLLVFCTIWPTPFDMLLADKVLAMEYAVALAPAATISMRSSTARSERLFSLYSWFSFWSIASSKEVLQDFLNLSKFLGEWSWTQAWLL